MESEPGTWGCPSEPVPGGNVVTSRLEGTSSTREVMERQVTADLFHELNPVTVRFAREHRRSLGLDQRSEQVAHLIAVIARDLFGGTWDIGAQVRASLGLDPWAAHDGLDDLVNRAHVLRKRINLSKDLEVDQTAQSGDRLDEQRQEPWKSSLPDAPIRFVVFPGMGSRGHVLVKQQVYTVSLQEARARARN
ncbi:hypothetical protein [Amycolatopsis lurida]|nr:hypothetical protein [Amycolatopsis lurida]